MKKDITPEEKLLRLIKSKKAPDERSTGKRKKTINIKKWITSKRPHLKIGAIKENIVGNSFRLLIILVIGVIIYFVADLLFITPYYRHKISEIDSHTLETAKEVIVMFEDELKEGIEQVPKAEPATPYSYYSKDIANRNIFKPLVQEEAKVVEDEFKKIRESLSLIGIISGEKLQAAIEDKVNKKTYFVCKGEHVGDIVVEDVLENKVILSYKGENFELML